jgi:hypothetical protein
MKRFFLIFVTLFLASAILVGCESFDNPANAKRIGSGHIKKDGNICYVEVDGFRYSPTHVYTINPIKKEFSLPPEGTEVTLFTMFDTATIEFIVGNVSEEELNEYFTTNSTIAWIFLGVFLISIPILFITEPKAKNVHCY